MIRAVIFDCFGVLYVDPTKYFYNLALKHHSKAEAEQLAELIRQTDRGYVSADEFCQHVAELFSLSKSLVKDKLLTGVDRNYELVGYLEQLRPRFKVAMLSNISRGTMNDFFSPEERKLLFDDTILSGDVGIIKPDPAIFALAAERLEVRLAEAVFIDDNEANCDGARAAGMQAIHYTSNAQVETALASLLKENTPV